MLDPAHVPLNGAGVARAEWQLRAVQVRVCVQVPQHATVSTTQLTRPKTPAPVARIGELAVSAKLATRLGVGKDVAFVA